MRVTTLGTWSPARARMPLRVAVEFTVCRRRASAVGQGVRRTRGVGGRWRATKAAAVAEGGTMATGTVSQGVARSAGDGAGWENAAECAEAATEYAEAGAGCASRGHLTQVGHGNHHKRVRAGGQRREGLLGARESGIPDDVVVGLSGGEPGDARMQKVRGKVVVARRRRAMSQIAGGRRVSAVIAHESDTLGLKFEAVHAA